MTEDLRQGDGALNPPLAGEGAKNAPPRVANFLNNLKTSAVIDAKLTLYSINMTHSHKIVSEIHLKVFEKMAF